MGTTPNQRPLARRSNHILWPGHSPVRAPDSYHRSHDPHAVADWTLTTLATSVASPVSTSFNCSINVSIPPISCASFSSSLTARRARRAILGTSSGKTHNLFLILLQSIHIPNEGCNPRGKIRMGNAIRISPPHTLPRAKIFPSSLYSR